MSDFDIEDLLPKNPITPVRLGLDDTIQFDCHPGISCFNACCRSIDITLTPYDILRLKNHLGLTSREFLSAYTVPFEMDGHGMPGVKMRTKGNTTECQFLTEQGCGVYGDRPSACRYYPVGLLSMRKKDSPTDEDFYFVVKEDHCQGHFEPRTVTIRDYRREQGVDLYDDLNREWRQILLKKRSAGPTIGQPSRRSLQLFFLASYDLEGFREFIRSEGFQEAYDIPGDEMERLVGNEVELMKFGFRFLKQVLFDEKSIAVKPDAVDKRVQRKRERLAAQRQAREQPGGDNPRSGLTQKRRLWLEAHSKAPVQGPFFGPGKPGPGGTAPCGLTLISHHPLGMASEPLRTTRRCPAHGPR